MITLLLACAPGELEPGLYAIEVTAVVTNDTADDPLGRLSFARVHPEDGGFSLLGAGAEEVMFTLEGGAFAGAASDVATVDLDASCARTESVDHHGELLSSTSFEGTFASSFAYSGDCGEAEPGGYTVEVFGEAMGVCERFADAVDYGEEILSNADSCGTWTVRAGAEVMLSVYLAEAESACEVVRDPALTLPYGEGTYTNLGDDGPKYTYQVLVDGTPGASAELWVACDDGSAWGGMFEVVEG
ncbi:MAG: hypothetical protein FJ102_10940 [Deltaproteobacteria bacterium]|nr:hypothetical protein [Deltaproteobacteria bacterium]